MFVISDVIFIFIFILLPRSKHGVLAAGNEDCTAQELVLRYVPLHLILRSLHARISYSLLRRDRNYGTKQAKRIGDREAVASGVFTDKQFNRVSPAYLWFCLHVRTSPHTFVAALHAQAKRACHSSPRRHVAQHETFWSWGLRRSEFFFFAFCLPCFDAVPTGARVFQARPQLYCIDACNLDLASKTEDRIHARLKEIAAKGMPFAPYSDVSNGR